MSTKCPHGYWTHSMHRCPGCHGVGASNQDVIPHVGPGNGWPLKRGEVSCRGCGGPAGSGYGLLPNAPTRAQAEAIRAADIRRARLCYGCGVDGLKNPLAVIRFDKGQGPGRHRVIRNGDGEVYVQCKGCWRWGREGWAHACGENWSASIRELNEPRRRDLMPGLGAIAAPALVPGNERF